MLNKILKNIKSNKKTAIPFLVGVLVILIPILYLQFRKPESAEAWFNDNWTYRKKLTITNAGAADSDKRVKFDVDTSTLISANKMQSTCNDIRFTDINGKLLPYYLDSAGGACDTVSTDLWILVNQINAGDTILYMYYGNPTAIQNRIGTQFSQAEFSPSGTAQGSEEDGPSPIAFWKFDEDYGGIQYDSSSYENNLIFSSSTLNNGDGHDGAKTVTGTDSSSFSYIAVDTISGSSQTNADRIEVGDTSSVAAGDDVLVIQMEGTGQGSWETCEVQSVSLNDYIDCESDLAYEYQSTGAQVVVMPQWTDVTIQDGGTLTTSAWNGTTGGIVAFRATSDLSIAADTGGGGGLIDVSGLGFESGTSPAGGAGGGGGATSSPGSAGSAGGNGSSGYGPGAGNGGTSAGGAGGGGGFDVFGGGSGGGGGGGASGGGSGGAYATTGNAGITGTSGPGGLGGDSGGGAGSAGTGGEGSGGSVGSTYGSADLTTMYLGSGGSGGASGAGGGGGGGHFFFTGGDGGDGGTGGTGGKGGGIIFAYTNSITINGLVSADGAGGSAGAVGEDGESLGNTPSGAGGGGAPGSGGGGGSGGSIYLVSNNMTIGSSLLTANGGDGGSAGASGGDGGENNGAGGPYSGGSSSEGAGGGGAGYNAVGGNANNGSAGAGGGGGDGRIHLEYSSLSGTASPTPDTAQISVSGYPTVEVPDLCLDNRCLGFNSSNNEYATITDDPDFDFAAAQDFTITGWFRRGQVSTKEVMVSKYESSGADGGYQVYMDSDGDVVFGIDDDNTSFPEDTAASTNADYDDNRWHHFAAVKNGTTSISLYIDGALVQTNSSTGADNTLENDDDYFVGIEDGDSNAFGGFLDEVKVYRYARSAAEIKTEYNGHTVVMGADVLDLSDGLVGYWKLDENTANTCADSVEDACDSSGNGNDGDWLGDAGNDLSKFGLGFKGDGLNDAIA
jgi:hypothetical protein